MTKADKMYARGVSDGEKCFQNKVYDALGMESYNVTEEYDDPIYKRGFEEGKNRVRDKLFEVLDIDRFVEEIVEYKIEGIK